LPSVLSNIFAKKIIKSDNAFSNYSYNLFIYLFIYYVYKTSRQMCDVTMM